jgi:hypothetical protein
VICGGSKRLGCQSEQDSHIGMLSTMANEILVSIVLCIVLIDVNACHANVIDCFYDVLNE